MKLKEGDIVRITFRRKIETLLDEEFNSCLEGLFWIKSIWTDENCDLFPVGQTTRKKIFLFGEEHLELAEEQELCQTLNSIGLL
jgi:hypothetical protein